jgi:murein DD-endopeptidase MepM/ murein hydrolase activator NlpD
VPPRYAQARVRRLCQTLLALVACALAACGTASAYGWPVKPFNRMHPIRGAFDDPRFHLGSEGALSAFHFGIDIAAKDGTPVYSVERGSVTAHAADVTVTTPSGRGFGYWHIRPVVRSGQRVRKHQLIGYVGHGWGHVHFAESVDRQYRNPLRPRALTPYTDHVPPTVASVALQSGGAPVDARRVTGSVDVVAEVYDMPTRLPPAPWQVDRLTPAVVWWRIERGDEAVTDWCVTADVHFALMPASIYSWIYAPGTYQNKANRPGRYLFWITHGFDTTTLPNGRYTIDVLASDTRWNIGSGSLTFTVANAATSSAPPYAPGLVTATRRPA